MVIKKGQSPVVALLIILGLGVALALLFFIISDGVFALPTQYATILITYSSVLFFGAVFSHTKDQLKLAAEAVNQAKSELISNMGHDLKSPFIGIEGNVQILRDYYSEKDPEIKEFWDQTLASIGEIITLKTLPIIIVHAVIVSYNHSFSHLPVEFLMPIYEYECTNCHHHFDQLQKISDASVTQCPRCSENTARRLVSAAGFQLKGSGWYATDFKNKTKPTNKDETTTESKDKVASSEVKQSAEKSTKGETE